jgi:hypothetical protein
MRQFFPENKIQTNDQKNDQKNGRMAPFSPPDLIATDVTRIP